MRGDFAGDLRKVLNVTKSQVTVSVCDCKQYIWHSKIIRLRCVNVSLTYFYTLLAYKFGIA